MIVENDFEADSENAVLLTYTRAVILSQRVKSDQAVAKSHWKKLGREPEQRPHRTGWLRRYEPFVEEGRSYRWIVRDPPSVRKRLQTWRREAARKANDEVRPLPQFSYPYGNDRGTAPIAVIGSAWVNSRFRAVSGLAAQFGRVRKSRH
ncbi:hypothetical protein ACFHWW_04460 [Ensifer sp. P24N7]|uniref:hypothetical protein n=1 Tax=Sinorhizobium sp. P24N7 TaxID=3348358 RepID=UPI0035F482AC